MNNDLIQLQKILQNEFNKEFSDEETTEIWWNLMRIFDLILANIKDYE